MQVITCMSVGALGKYIMTETTNNNIHFHDFIFYTTTIQILYILFVYTT